MRGCAKGRNVVGEVRSESGLRERMVEEDLKAGSHTSNVFIILVVYLKINLRNDIILRIPYR